MKLYKIQNRSQTSSHSCIPLIHGSGIMFSSRQRFVSSKPPQDQELNGTLKTAEDLEDTVIRAIPENNELSPS